MYRKDVAKIIRKLRFKIPIMDIHSKSSVRPNMSPFALPIRPPGDSNDDIIVDALGKLGYTSRQQAHAACMRLYFPSPFAVSHIWIVTRGEAFEGSVRENIIAYTFFFRF